MTQSDKRPDQPARLRTEEEPGEATQVIRPKMAGRRVGTMARRPESRGPELIRRALMAFEERLAEVEFKPTLAEYLKLLQLAKDIDDEEAGPKEIRVTWVEPEWMTAPEE